MIFLGADSYPGSILLLGAFIYAVQIYADFSGYSDIAIGCGKLFGIKLMRNFAFPYFATNIADFWRRWHISLTTWFRDYVYIPLGGNRCSKAKQVRNVLLVFLLSGLWHGANRTFVIWGLVHACLFMPLIFLRKRQEDKRDSWTRTLLGWSFTMLAVMLAWVFFRADSFGQSMSYFSHMFSVSLFVVPHQFLSMLPWILVCLVFEWFQRHREHAFQIAAWPMMIRWPLYVVTATICLAYQQRSGEFIYFQF